MHGARVNVELCVLEVDAVIGNASREHLVDTAFKFLKNPRVAGSPPNIQRAFLRKKGLTDVEIEDVFLRAGVHRGTSLAHAQHLAQSPAGPPASRHSWRWRDVGALSAVIAAIGFGINRLYKWLAAVRAAEAQRLTDVESTVSAMAASLTHAVTQLQTSVAGTHELLSRQQKQLERLTDDTAVSKASGPLLADLRTEIASIKGLMLGRKQFPCPPNSAAILPSWQLALKPSTSTGTTISSTMTSQDVNAATNKEQQLQPRENTDTLTGSSENVSSSDISPISHESASPGLDSEVHTLKAEGKVNSLQSLTQNGEVGDGFIHQHQDEDEDVITEVCVLTKVEAQGENEVD
ncbi:peroxisomal membrane protein PEX14-like isoform X2 [Petromyzon marinus]|uniref:Peroxisomal membrane protein PEX14 n=1 Tax=Petromyzon marinus TaxID=7757 RepID=A0AAJ7TKE4_PETMA|nr:peroxisomal membrane protein PEX14-like isoform X2 [Petromyzon marinus]